MAGASAATAYTPSNEGLYGMNTLPNPVTVPPGLFNGLGPAQLNTSALPLQTFNPTAISPSDTQAISDFINLQQNPNGDSYLQSKFGFGPTSTPSGLSGLYSALSSGADKAWNNINTTQNSNLAGYNATQSANAQNIGYLQQAAIAQNRLLGELNSRGLLNSFEQGGAGTGDFQQLQNSLNNAVNSQGTSLQNELSGLTQQDAMYQLALNNYQNALGQFDTMKQNNTPGLTDVLGLGISALPLIPGI